MFRLLASLLLVLAFSWPAFAQPTPNIHIASKGPWSVDCSAEPQTGEKWCEVSTTFKSDKPPYAVEFHYVRDSRMFFARGSVPLSGARVQVDSHAAYVFDRCLAGMCLLKGPPAERLLAELRSGTRLQLQFEARPQIPGPLAVELADFDAMYRATLAAPK
ncbi:MAG: invasion associated locus B family protein [Proteobacteria bacterium]|nr:invasion associated locus B family protein [Pseudomonadota bacterium]